MPNGPPRYHTFVTDFLNTGIDWVGFQVVSWLFTIPQVNTESIDHQGNSALATAALCGMDGMVRLLGDHVSGPCCVCDLCCVSMDYEPCCVSVNYAVPVTMDCDPGL